VRSKCSKSPLHGHHEVGVGADEVAQPGVAVEGDGDDRLGDDLGRRRLPVRHEAAHGDVEPVRRVAVGRVGAEPGGDGCVGEELRLELAGLDDGDADPERLHLVVQRLADRLEGVLRRRVGATERPGDEPGDGRDVDDDAAAPLAHRRQRRPHDAHDAEHVRVELGVQLLVGQLLDGSPQLDAGVVDDDVERPARRLLGLGDGGLDRRGVGDVERQHPHVEAFVGGHRLHRSRLVGVSHRGEHRVAVAAEQQRRQLAEARRAPGDEDAGHGPRCHTSPP
jgi:hypothetical protein